jgi:hypothetical protein
MRYTIVFTSRDARALSSTDATTAREALAIAEALQSQHGEIKFITSPQEGEFGVEMLRLLAKEEGEELALAPNQATNPGCLERNRRLRRTTWALRRFLARFENMSAKQHRRRLSVASAIVAGTRVYRLQTDAGERVIGGKVSAACVANALTTDTPELTPDAAFAALMEGRAVIGLAEGLQLRRVRVMGAYRIELAGFTDSMRDRLRAYGLFHEIISWKLRMFVPSDGSGGEILAKVLDHYPVARVGERETA